MQAAVETHSFIHIGRFRQVKVLQLSRDWEASLFARRFVSRHYSAEWTDFVLDSSSAKYFTRNAHAGTITIGLVKRFGFLKWINISTLHVRHGPKVAVS